jgi:Leucine-rich repeat (LRR) protein
MRAHLAAVLLALGLGAPLHAGLEPGDEALLLRCIAGTTLVPGAMPVGYEHKFEIGDLQEIEVLDRGVYRTLRFHVVGNVGEEVICEAHNGRGLVFAGLMNNNGEFSKAWAGRSGERPVEVKFRRNQHSQQLLHDALRAPWPTTLYNLPASDFREGDKFRLGAQELTVQAATYNFAGVRYELARSHGADSWFGPYWQWTAEGVVLYRVTRREKLAKAEPLLDWSKVDAKIPRPTTPPDWTPPGDDWTVQLRADGSMLVFSYEADGEFQFLDRELNTVSGQPRIGPYGKRVVDAYSPGPFVIPAGRTLQLNAPNTDDWTQLDLLLAQAARLPVSMAVLCGPAAGDRGLKALKGYPWLESLDAFPLGTKITEQGFKAIAAMSKLWELALTTAGEDGFKAIGPLKEMKKVRKLALRAPDLTEIPAALHGWTTLENLEFTGKDIEGIGALNGLSMLSLVHSQVSRKGADEISALPKLRNLELHSTNVPASVIKKLTLDRLVITADSPEVASFQIEAAATLKQLKTLELAIKGLTGQDLSPLAGGSIETLVVSDGLAQSRDVAAIAKLTGLVNLTLVKLKGADAAALTSLSSLTNLRTFTLSSPVLERSRTASVELAALAKFSFLEELHVIDGGMARLGTFGLDKFGKLKRLTLDNLNIEAPVTDELATCDKLESLSLADSLLAKGASDKLGTLKTLKRLDLRANFSLLKEDLEKLRAALPGCEILT